MTVVSFLLRLVYSVVMYSIWLSRYHDCRTCTYVVSSPVGV